MSAYDVLKKNPILYEKFVEVTQQLFKKDTLEKKFLEELIDELNSFDDGQPMAMPRQALNAVAHRWGFEWSEVDNSFVRADRRNALQ